MRDPGRQHCERYLEGIQFLLGGHPESYPQAMVWILQILQGPTRCLRWNCGQITCILEVFGQPSLNHEPRDVANFPEALKLLTPWLESNSQKT